MNFYSSNSRIYYWTTRGHPTPFYAILNDIDDETKRMNITQHVIIKNHIGEIKGTMAQPLVSVAAKQFFWSEFKNKCREISINLLWATMPVRLATNYIDNYPGLEVVGEDDGLVRLECKLAEVS